MTMQDEYFIRPVDPNIPERREDAEKLRRKPIDESVEGVIPFVGDVDDRSGKQAAQTRQDKNRSLEVNDLLNNGHGYGVTTMPQAPKARPKVCQREGCDNALLFQIKPCKGSVLPWLPTQTKMLGVPEFDGEPLEWWDAMRLFCKCGACAELTTYVQGGNKVGSVRKYCSDTCRKGAHKARTAADKKAVDDRFVFEVGDVVAVLDGSDIEYIQRMSKKRLRSGAWGTDALHGTVHHNPTSGES